MDEQQGVTYSVAASEEVTGAWLVTAHITDYPEEGREVVALVAGYDAEHEAREVARLLSTYDHTVSRGLRNLPAAAATPEEQ